MMNASSPLWSGRFFALTVCLALFSIVPGAAIAQYQAAPVTVSPDLAGALIQGWASALVRNDLQGLAVYYADPQGVTPWKQRLAARRVTKATLVAVHGIRPAPEKSWGGVPLSGEVRFTMEFWIEGYNQAINETRVWGLTNRNGYLQIASEIREEAPAVAAGQAGQSVFPQFGNDPEPVVPPPPPTELEPVPEPVTESVQTSPTSPDGPQTYSSGAPLSQTPPSPAPTPERRRKNRPPLQSLNESPIEKAVLVQQLWDQLLQKWAKAHSMRSEQMFISRFVRTPGAALQEFRNRVRQHGWMKVENLAIDEDSVRGNQLNATFRFRYSLWGPGLKRNEMIEVDAAATRGGPGVSPGWRFFKFNDEVLMEMPRAPGYYPNPQILNAAVTPAAQPGPQIATPSRQPQQQNRMPFVMPQQQQQRRGFGFFGR